MNSSPPVVVSVLPSVVVPSVVVPSVVVPVLVPSVVVTVLASLWVGWLGGEGGGEVDADVANARLARALGRERPRRYAAPPAPVAEHASGVAVRPRAARPPGAEPTRRAS